MPILGAVYLLLAVMYLIYLIGTMVRKEIYVQDIVVTAILAAYIIFSCVRAG